jgi:purine-binding chemotaxis protein CheW
MATVTKLAGETVGQEFLVFTLGDEEYGIDILKVQEIRGYDQVTRIANTPAFIKGVTNLRGVIVPIVDLRVKFSQEDVEYNDNTVVIVLNLGQRVVGIVVDGVSDVLSLAAEQIRPAPEFAVTLSTEYLTGLGALGALWATASTTRPRCVRPTSASAWTARWTSPRRRPTSSCWRKA